MRASRPTAARVGGAIPVGPKHKFIRRGGIYPARGPCGGAGSPGRCEHRPLQGFVVSPGSHFPGWPRALPPFVGADSISARGGSRRRGVRRDEGIPPYGRRVGGAIPVGPKHQFIRRGGIYPAHGRSRGIRSPGTMQASSPTEVYYSARTAVSRLAACPPLVVGADSISARGGLRRRGVRRDEGIRPTAARVGGAIPVGSKHKICP